MKILREINMIPKSKVVLSLIICIAGFIFCDGPASDRVSHRKCKEEEKNSAYALLLLMEELKIKKTAEAEASFNALSLFFYGRYDGCLERWRLSPKIIDPLDNLFWNGCGRCYK